MPRRDTRTPTFWTTDDPPGMLPAGQRDLPFAASPGCARCGDDYGGFLPPCILPKGHTGRHTAGVGLGDGLTDSWGTLDPANVRRRPS